MNTAFCFDLDGTVTRDEILPVLSREIGLFEEIAALTEATIKGVIPFRKSFLLRCRLLSDIPVSRVQAIVQEIALHGEIAEFIRGNRDRCFIITGNLDVWIGGLVDSLGCRCFSSRASVEGDKMTSVDHVLHKGDAVREIKCEFEKVVAIGDGMGDVPMFEEANVRVAFGGTHQPIQTLIEFSDFVTYNEKSLCRLLNMQ
jgi:phosphoserine phosphatase